MFTPLKGPSTVPLPVQPYATPEELKNMERVHVPSIIFMKKFLGELSSMERGRALDVAGGDGRIIKAVLHDPFTVIDIFDRD